MERSSVNQSWAVGGEEELKICIYIYIVNVYLYEMTTMF